MLLPALLVALALSCTLYAGWALAPVSGAGSLSVALSWPRRLVRARVQKRAPLVRQVIVVTLDGTSLKGVLLTETHEYAELASVAVAHKGERAFGPVLDGKVLVPREQLSYIQVL